MFVVCNRIAVNPEYTEALEERFKQRAGLVDGMPGFVSFNLMRPKDPKDPYIVMTIWESEADFRAWTESEQFRKQHDSPRQIPEEALPERPRLEMFEIIQQTLAHKA